MLTHREVVACLLALEEVHPRILRGLEPDAWHLVKRLRALR